jgi:hypothetical protein
VGSDDLGIEILIAPQLQAPLIVSSVAMATCSGLLNAGGNAWEKEGKVRRTNAYIYYLVWSRESVCSVRASNLTPVSHFHVWEGAA